MLKSQKGTAPILILLAGIGLIGFLVVSNTAEFKDKLFSGLFPKPSSEAFKGEASPTPTGQVQDIGDKGTGSESYGIDKNATPEPSVIGHPSGWHPPIDHEHGEAPPQWVLDSQWQPFTQTREGHRGYKGYYSKDAHQTQVESYIIVHIITTPGARSHGDHDYQLWVREPNGTVSHWGKAGAINTSVLDFGTPPPLFASKPDDRPSIQDVNDNETWYMRLGVKVFDLAQIIYGPNFPFNPAVPAGDGSERSLKWQVYANRFPGRDVQYVSPTLAQYCTQVSGGKVGCRFEFFVDHKDFAIRTMTIPN